MGGGTLSPDRLVASAAGAAIACAAAHAALGTSAQGRAVVGGAGVALVITAMIPPAGRPGLEGARWISAGLAALALIGAEAGFAAALAIAPFLYVGWWLATAASGDTGGPAGPDPVERPAVAFAGGLAALALGLAWLIASPVAWIVYATGPNDASALLWPWTAAPGATAIAIGAGAVRAVRRARHPGS